MLHACTYVEWRLYVLYDVHPTCAHGGNVYLVLFFGMMCIQHIHIEVIFMHVCICTYVFIAIVLHSLSSVEDNILMMTI